MQAASRLASRGKSWFFSSTPDAGAHTNLASKGSSALLRSARQPSATFTRNAWAAQQFRLNTTAGATQPKKTSKWVIFKNVAKYGLVASVGYGAYGNVFLRRKRDKDFANALR